MQSNDQYAPPPGSPKDADKARLRLEQDLISRFGSPEPAVDESSPDAEDPDPRSGPGDDNLD